MGREEQTYGSEYYLRHPLTVLDFETTGTNPLEDRPVSVALAEVAPEGEVRTLVGTLVNPEREVPEGATAVHGISTEQAAAFGAKMPDVIAEVVGHLRALAEQQRPLLIYNAPFDWPMLKAEVERCGLEPVTEVLLFDPLCIHKYVEPYFKGGRKLIRVAESFGFELTQAHDAIADAVACAQIGFSLMKRYPAVGGRTPSQLMAMQAEWHRRWAEKTNAYWKKAGREDQITNAWPEGVLA